MGVVGSLFAFENWDDGGVLWGWLHFGFSLILDGMLEHLWCL